MQTIHKLPPHVADLIAAGEVVSRPASAVKELVENALDAGASNITVEIQRGGARFIRVTDDGCGMSAEDAATAFLRHATSKISKESDLAAITTMGFRGEALAAIAAVSRVELLTKRRGELIGTAVTLEAGNVIRQAETGCPEGTTIVINELFYNTPARQKFMKKDSTEAGHVQSAVQKAALSRPDVAFKFIQDGRVDLRTTGDGKLQNAIYAVLGAEIAGGLIPVAWSAGDISITGFTGKPEMTRSSRNQQYFFVCGRPVYSRTLCAALEEAYKTAIPSGKCPVCVLCADLPYDKFDCNVHPAKTEVKFANDRELFDAVYAAVRVTLDKDSSRPEVKLPPSAVPPHNRPAEAHNHPAVSGRHPSNEGNGITGTITKQPDFFQAMGAEQFRTLRAGSLRESALQYETPLQIMSPAKPEVLLPSAKPEPPQTPLSIVDIELSTADYRIVGEVLGGYIVVEEEAGLVLIDRHAAHERILYNKLKETEHEHMSQILLAPVIVSLAPEDKEILLRHAETINRLGFEAEDFGGGSLRVTAVPDGISGDETGSVLSGVAECLRANKTDVTPELFDSLLHTIACKAAIKVGKGQNERDTQYIADTVMNTPSLKTCPHGRPVAVTLTKASLERQFGR